MIHRLLLSLLALILASCTPRSLKQEFPTTWDPDHRSETPRWVVAYPGSHSGALGTLKRAREARGYEVISIPGANPRRIQEQVASLKLGEREGDCLLLVGTTEALPGATGLHHRMKGILSDSRYAMTRNGSTPLFAVGRLPSSTPAQSRTLVKKILAFERARQSTRDNKSAVLLVGDPIGGSKRFKAADFLVSTLSRSLIRKAHRSWKIDGAADVPGHPFASSPREFPVAIRRQLNQPYTVAAYFGHSSSSTLCSTSGGTGTWQGTLKHSFGKESWDELTASHQRGLFLSCGCYCLAGDNAVGYRSVKAAGGPVAFIGATEESYSAIGYLAAKGAVEAMRETPPPTVGDWFLAVQEAIARAPISRPLFFAFDKVDGSDGELTLHAQRLEHLEMWMLVGDPATALF